MQLISGKNKIKIVKDLFEKGGFTPVINTADGRKWHNDLYENQRKEYEKDNTFSEEKFKRNFCMSADNRQIFKRMFGKPTFHFRGEFFYSDYVFEYKGHLFLAGTAKDKGTVFEVHKIEGKPFKGVVYEFLEEFNKQLLGEIDAKNN